MLDVTAATPEGDVMSSKSFYLVLLGFFIPPFTNDAAAQQQVTVSSPHTAVSDSFFEHTGTSWGMRGKNWFFQFGPRGNPNGAAPQFGGFSPSAGANVGFGFNGGGVGGGFLGNFSQGSRRSFTSTTPSVTLQNGGTGMIMDTSVSPFVMGYVPVVGGYPMIAAPPPVQPMTPPPAYIPPGPAPGHPGVLQALQNVSDKPAPPKLDVVGDHVAEADADDFTLVGPGQSSADNGRRLAGSAVSSAGRPAMGVAEARRLHEAESAQYDAEAQKFLERGRHAEADGKVSLARTYYQMAVRRASHVLRDQALKQLAALPKPEEKPR
jgi:hypothetical protein